MKNILKYLMCLCIIVGIAGCSDTKTEETQSKEIAFLCPNGAPALAFVAQYEHINQNGKIDFVDGTDTLIAQLSKADSEYDVIVAPINLGTKLIASGQTDFRLSAVITWGNLYYVGTSVEALQGNGEIALFGQGAVPETIVNAVAIDTTLTPNYYHSAPLVQQQLLAGNVEVGMLAEPLASATIAKAKQEGIELSIIKDLQAEYNSGKGYPQAAIFVKEGVDLEALYENLDAFTNNGYVGLQGYLETIGIETLGLPSVDIVVSSIERQNIHFVKATACQEEIAQFLELFDITFTKDMLIND